MIIVLPASERLTFEPSDVRTHITVCARWVLADGKQKTLHQAAHLCKVTVRFVSEKGKSGSV